MPIQACTVKGRRGYKYGDKGTCYTGPDAYRKAAAQGKAIEASMKRRGTMAKGETHLK